MLLSIKLPPDHPPDGKGNSSFGHIASVEQCRGALDPSANDIPHAGNGADEPHELRDVTGAFQQLPFGPNMEFTPVKLGSLGPIVFENCSLFEGAPGKRVAVKENALTRAEDGAIEIHNPSLRAGVGTCTIPEASGESTSTGCHSRDELSAPEGDA